MPSASVSRSPSGWTRRYATTTSTTIHFPAVTLAVGPLGYNGSRAAMELISKADVVLALGTRLNPFSTLPCYGLDYWPKEAAVIQVDINADRIGLTKPVAVAICGDAKLVAAHLLAQLTPGAGDTDRAARRAQIVAAEAGLGRGACRAGSRGRRSGHRLERRMPIARARTHVATPGLARHRGRPAAGCDHLERYRQQLRDRQCLSDLRARSPVSGTWIVWPLRLWVSVDHWRETWQSDHTGGRIRRRRRLWHLDE